jgi:hypothetical protein
MKCQVLDEVIKSLGYKTLKDELAKKIEAVCRDWAMQFLLPVQDLNIFAMKKRYQLSFCRLLSTAAKGFNAQASAKGYDANAAVMDLLAMHGDDVPTPLNVNAHDFLVLFKEAAGLTVISFPIILHNLTGVINKVNSDALAGALGNSNKILARMTMTTTTMMGAMVAMTMMAAAGAAAVAVVAATATTAATAMMALAATTATMATMEATATAVVAALAVANALTKPITAAAAAVTCASSQKDLAHAMAEQARSIADKALECCTIMCTAFEEARCARATMINPINIA